MHYHEAAEFLFDLRRFSVRPGTEGIEALLDHLGRPEAELPFVQIAGSNGKGSTARMVESILREAGLSVGLYTSPHLESLSERIRVDGRRISDRAIADFVATVKPWLVTRAATGEPLTFFEVVTAMAIHDFARREADVAVLEVGLGGEFDATSAVDPVATAVTNVSLEHTSILGDTIGEIARTKSRIASGGVPLVTACSGEALSVIREVAAEFDAPVTTVVGPGVNDPRVTQFGGAGRGGLPKAVDCPDASTDDPAIVATYGGRVSATDATVSFAGEFEGDYRIPLVGAHQATNAAIAAALARRTFAAIGPEATDVDAPDARLPESAVADGLTRATWPGRFEVVRTEPLVVLDGAHNPAACSVLAGTLSAYEYDDLHLVYAAMHDKAHVETVASLPEATSVVTCRPDLERAEDPEVLAAAARAAGIGDVTAGTGVADAFAVAMSRAADDDCVLLAGSLFAVAEARAALMRTVTPRALGDGRDTTRMLERAGLSPSTSATLRDGFDHRTVTVRLRGDQARHVVSTLRAVGGEAGIGGAGTGAGELVPVTLSGTVAEFRTLCDRLSAESDTDVDDLSGIAADLRSRVAIPDGAPEKHRGSVGSEAEDVPWADRTAVMGVLNATPDSFHDGGRHAAVDDALAGANRMVDAGVDVIDVGGESTRPGAEPVSIEEELRRVLPVVEAIRTIPAVDRGDVLVSVDTRKPAVAAAVLDAGADVINDVTGLEDPRMRDVVADADCSVVVMHSHGAPVDPDSSPEYGDVVDDVIADLAERLSLAEAAGIDRDRLIVDPGIGFGKSAAESFALLSRVSEFDALDCPVLIGHSHKSLFGAIGLGPQDREHATVAGTAIAAVRGADIVRVHDVDANRAAVDVVAAVRDSRSLE